MQAIILIGLPGSGKTTWAKKNFSEATHCCADDFFTQPDGSYKFDLKKAGEAHAQCIRSFIKAMERGEKLYWKERESSPGLNQDEFPFDVVVDNCNCTVHAIAPYIGIACAFGVFPRLVMVRNPGNAFERQTHGVDEFQWNAMRHQLNEMLSRWPGIWPKLETVMS